MSAPMHVHLPSLHVRNRDGSGFDYEEDLSFPEGLEDDDADLDVLDLPSDDDGAELDYLEAKELERQSRIAAGIELACASCGCSETQPCEGGCVWATPNLCSRCV